MSPRETVFDQSDGRFVPDFLEERIRTARAPWQKPWNPMVSLPPFNPVTGLHFRCFNRIGLSLEERRDPRWITNLQLRRAGLKTLPGEESSRLLYWQTNETNLLRNALGLRAVDPDGGSLVAEVELVSPNLRRFNVFNLAQTLTPDGGEVEPFEYQAPDWDPIDEIEAAVKATGAKITHSNRNGASFQYEADEILMPLRHLFPTRAGYYHTLLHELVHWTGHPSRLDRERGRMGSAAYAGEELLAEMTAFMIAQDLRVEIDPGHQEGRWSYMKSWFKEARQNPHAFHNLCNEADRIRSWVVGLAP